MSKQISCDLCPKTFASRSGLFYHKQMHSGVQKYFCEQCNQSIVYLSNQPDRIFQLTKAFKVATPDNRDIQEELGRSQGSGVCRRQYLCFGRPTQHRHHCTSGGSGWDHNHQQSIRYLKIPDRINSPIRPEPDLVFFLIPDPMLKNPTCWALETESSIYQFQKCQFIKETISMWQSHYPES